MNFGNNLKIFRKNSGMSQEELAEKIGVTRQSVSKWEVGEAYPEMSNIVALCKIFHCNINDLINDNIIDADSFDKDTKDGLIKFKKNQQKNMKRLSKAIYIISNMCEIVVAIPALVLIFITILFPFLSSNFEIKEDSIKVFNKEYTYTVENNLLTFNGKQTYIDSTTDVKEFIESHSNKFFIVSIEYILICITILSILSVVFLHYLAKLYKNIYEKDTPFTIENEKIINIVAISLLIQLVLTKLTAAIYASLAKIDLAIDMNIKDIISVLIILSLIYLFKYGRMIQVDTKAKIYGEE